MRHTITCLTVVVVIAFAALLASSQSPSPTLVPTKIAAPIVTAVAAELSPETRGVKTTRVGIPDGGDEEFYVQSYALVIGMNDYRHWRKLPGTLTDVAEVKAVLEEHGFIVETAFDLPRKGLMDRIDEFIRNRGKKEGCRIIIYFAGHGYTLKRIDGSSDSNGYIVPIDAPNPELDTSESKEEFRKAAIEYQVIQSWAKSIETKHAMLIFDSCFSGFATRGSGKVPNLISRAMARRARQFISSGGEDQQVPDVSVFREVFVEGLRGAADTSGGGPDGYVTGKELAEYIKARVDQIRGKDQTPQSMNENGAGNGDGDMVFSLRYPSSMTEEDAWKQAESTNTIRTNRLFINSFPNSKNVATAQKRITEIYERQRITAGNQLATSATVSRGRPQPTFSSLGFRTATLDSRGVKSQKDDSAEVLEEDLGDGEKIKLVRITGGQFLMGSSQIDGPPSEKPAHKVNVDSMYFGAFEITRKQWNIVSNWEKEIEKLERVEISGEEDNFLPVTGVSWSSAVEFCRRLSKRTGRTYSLPSEAEWEYAARAGTTTLYSTGDQISGDIANFDATSPENPVGSLKPRLRRVGSTGYANSWGIFDMHGNAAEWCDDDWFINYSGASGSESRRSDSSLKVTRGGSFQSKKERVTSSSRSKLSYDATLNHDVGFRVITKSIVTRQ